MTVGRLHRGVDGHGGRADEGSLALYLALMAVGLLAMAGLVIDGGAALAARGRAADIAQEAARAGADAITEASLRGASPAQLQIDPAAARAAAQRLLTLHGAGGEVTIASRDVTVIAHVPQHAVVLSAVGITDLTGTATATATILNGTTAP